MRKYSKEQLERDLSTCLSWAEASCGNKADPIVIAGILREIWHEQLRKEIKARFNNLDCASLQILIDMAIEKGKIALKEESQKEAKRVEQEAYGDTAKLQGEKVRYQRKGPVRQTVPPPKAKAIPPR